jgi:hypothetical protein
MMIGSIMLPKLHHVLEAEVGLISKDKLELNKTASHFRSSMHDDR